ncbi:MAG: peptidoglycan DD-metalloendopeptidase family protein [Bacteroidetes bacterium]|nr:peptidoglycan DD-metalloendopeptidase family protein [Bacteroidota bacterium]
MTVKKNIKELVLLAFVVPVVIIYLIVSISKCSQSSDDALGSDSVVVNINEFGFVSDSLKEYREKVQKNQTLSDLLIPHNVSFQTIHDIAAASQSVFDLKKINVGNTYTIFSDIDSVESVKYFVYEIDPINYIICDLRDSIYIHLESREVVTKIREISGIIEYSLYSTLSGINASDLLALKMADAFAWQIDFYGIQKGDFFKIIFEENYVQDKLVGIGKINAALFNHRSKDYYAFRFEQEGQDEYFDEHGNSLRKAFLKAPLKFSRISSRYTNKRFHPVLKYYRPHRGIDYAAPAGTHIQSVGDGLITDVRWTNQGGRFVKIKHNSTYSSGYMHLQAYAKGIKVGKRIRQGDVIGYVGSSGLATGPHLDFRFWKNNELVNYLSQEFPSSRPIDKKDQLAFTAFKDSIKIKIDAINVNPPSASALTSGTK